MADNEKLDLILSKLDNLENEIKEVKEDVQGMKTEIQNVKNDTHSLKRQIMKSTVELKGMNEMVLDEVERVHEILDMHKADKSAHMA